MRRTKVTAAALLPLVAAITTGGAAAGSTGPAQLPALAPGVPGSPVRHVVEIMIENHTFDNLFGRFPGADGIPADASFLNPDAYYDSAPNVSPAWAGPSEGDVQGAINNSAAGEQMAMDYQPGKALTIRLDAETGGLSPGSSVAGRCG